MTIGIYDGYAFLIKDINKLAKNFVCADCQGRFTKVGNLQRHARERWAQGKTVIDCANERVEAHRQRMRERFTIKVRVCRHQVRCLERTSKALGKHIHHVLCGHGGEVD